MDSFSFTPSSVMPAKFSPYRLSLLLLFGVITAIRTVSGGYKTVCYYESWAVYRRIDGKLGADFSVNPPPCTHLIYAFAVIKDGVIEPFDALVDLDGDGQYAGYQKFNLITKNPKPVKTLLAIGGWNAGSKEFSDMSVDPDAREEFAKQAITYLRRHGFQGLDIDWEYPADRDGARPEDKENFSALLQDIRTAFDAEVLEPGRERLLLTVALSPHPDKLDKSYDLSAIAPSVDFVNLMTYDYARAGWSMEIKPHNPLWKRPEDTPWQSQLNAEWAVQSMIKGGIPAEKLILGIPTYGTTYKINSKTVPKIHGSHLGGGDAGPVTKEKGYLAFHEVCRRMKLETGWTASMDQSGVPVCYRNNEWMSYENPKSARNKALFAMRYRLGGAMVWSLATDDFNGFCYGKRYPLTQILRDTFDASSKMMGRVDPYGTSVDTAVGSSSDTAPQYCVADAKADSTSAGKDSCQVKVYCPEINRSFLPYELSCSQTLGKCSYPRVQICDVPKLSKGSKPKYLLYMDNSKPANVTCLSGLSTKTTMDVVTVNSKCKKESLSCQGNMLGGYNIINYICPAGSQFDTTLKVCKIPDTLDPDDDPCAQEIQAPLPRRPLVPVQTPVSVKAQLKAQQTGYQVQLKNDYDKFRYSLVKPDYYDSVEDIKPTEAPITAPEILDPSNELGNDGQSSQIDQQVLSSQSDVDIENPKEDSSDVNADSIPSLPMPVRQTPAPPPVHPIFPRSRKPQPVFRSKKVTPITTASVAPPRTRAGPPRPPTRLPLMSRIQSADTVARTDASPVADSEFDGPICAPIGSRVPNPKKPCSSSFLVCLSPRSILELNCAKGMIFDGLVQFCVPPGATASCK